MAISKRQKFLLESDFVFELLKQIPAHIFWKNENSVYLGCNNTFAHSLGLSSPEEIIGKTDYDLATAKEESDAFRADDKLVIKSKQPKLNIEESQTLPDGRKITLLTNKVPLFDKKKNVIGILGIYYDITERKLYEQAIISAKEKADAANKAKTEFLENMRHDIRTPLTGITGFASMIADEVQDPKIKDYVDNLSASSYALLDLLNEILELVKVSSGEIPVLKKKFDLKKKLTDVINLNRARAHHKHIDLLFDYDTNIPPYLIGDSTRIHRIALELVANALNFTQQGSVRLSTELAKVEGRDLVIKIIVEDTGIGIEPEKQQEIFQQFKKLTPSYTGIHKGAGLGLAIVKQFIDEMQGEIYVESQLGTGSKFICVLPFKRALLDEAQGSEDKVAVQQLHKKYLHII
jgi:two-component system aerobic respiration control sensor histidine kinase ArcB